MQHSAGASELCLKSNLLPLRNLLVGIEPVLAAVEQGGSMGRKGFSLIEMIIVLILIGVIASISFPRLRDGLEKQNIRSAKALIATLAATARGAAIQRGCSATLNLTVDSIWVTACGVNPPANSVQVGDRKSTRLNSSHLVISYAVFCLKKKKKSDKDIHKKINEADTLH